MNGTKNKKHSRTVFKRKRIWSIFTFLLGIIFFVFGTEMYESNQDDWYFYWGYVALSFLSFSATLVSLVVRLELRQKELQITSLFNRQSFLKSEIEKVTWQKGSGISLRLKNGDWIGIPEVGENIQGMANSIRAWLKRG